MTGEGASQKSHWPSFEAGVTDEDRERLVKRIADLERYTSLTSSIPLEVQLLTLKVLLEIRDAVIPASHR